MILGESYLEYYNSQFYSRECHDSRESICPGSKSNFHTVYVYNQLEVLGGKDHGVGSCGIPHVGSLSLIADREGNILRHSLCT